MGLDAGAVLRALFGRCFCLHRHMVKVVGVLHEFLYVLTCLRIGSDNVDGSDVVTGGEAPHMKVVECLYTVHGQDVMAKGLHIDISGGAL